MRSYRINTDRVVNQLIPHYLGGRKLILYVQSLLEPLNSLNRKWQQAARKKIIESKMTSQVILLENFLNQEFGKYLIDPSQRILISDGVIPGVPVYWEEAEEKVDGLVLYKDKEPEISGHKAKPFYWEDEQNSKSNVSFTVFCPPVNDKLISKEELTGMITYYVNMYKIAGKKFVVTYNL